MRRRGYTLSAGAASAAVTLLAGALLGPLTAPAGATPTGEIELYGTSTTADTGLAADPGTSPSIGGTPDGAYELAYVDSAGILSVSNPTASMSLGVAVAAGTSPSVTGLPAGGYEAVFQFTNGALSQAGTAGTAIGTKGMKAGTSPDVTAVSGGDYLDAFESNDDQAWTEATDAGGNSGQAQAPATDAAVASVDGSYELAFQGANGDLWRVNRSAATDTKFGMQADTSPAIAAQPDDGYEIAFETNRQQLYVIDATSEIRTGETMATPAAGVQASNPSITELTGGGYEVAYVGADGNLCLYGSAGDTDTGIALEPGTSPSIIALSGGGYEVAYAAPATAPPAAPAPAPPTTTAGTTTSTLSSPPAKHRAKKLPVHVQMAWRWHGRRTVLERVRIHRLPPTARVTVRCTTKACARPRTRTATHAHLARLQRQLDGDRFTAGEHLLISVTGPGYRSLRAEVVFRAGRHPLIKRLTKTSGVPDSAGSARRRSSSLRIAARRVEAEQR